MKQHKFWLLGITLLGLFIRVYSVGHAGFWVDEINSVQCISGGLGHLWHSLVRAPSELLYANPNTNPPFYFLVLWAWCKLFGLSEAAVRMPSVLVGAMTIPLLAFLAEKVESRKAGLMAALLLALHPAHVVYSREARPYTMAIFLAVLLALIAINIVADRRQSQGGSVWGSVVFSLVSSALMMTQYNLVFLPFLLFGWILFHAGRLRAYWSLWLLLPIGLEILWLPCLAEQLSDGSAYYAMSAWRIIGEGHNQFLSVTHLGLIPGFSAMDFHIPFGPDQIPFWCLLVAVPACLILVWDFIRSIAGFRLIWIFFCYAGALYILDALNPYMYSRYLLFVVPFFLAVVASNFMRAPKYLTGLSILALMIAWGFGDWAIIKPTWIKSKEREIAKAIEGLKGRAPCYLVCFPAYSRDAVFHYLQKGDPSDFKPVCASGPYPGRIRIVVLNLYPELSPTEDSRFAMVSALADTRDKQAFTMKASGSGQTEQGLVWETASPGQVMQRLGQIFKRVGPPFDPCPVWRI